MNTLTKFGSLIAVVLTFFALPAFASANACHTGTLRAHTVDTLVCGGPMLDCTQSCVCDTGFHPAATALANGDPDCVRNRRGDTNGDGIVDVHIYPTVCVDGAVRVGRYGCGCPPGAVGERPSRLVPTFISGEQRRAEGLPANGQAQMCISYDPLAGGLAPDSPNRVVVDAIDQNLRILCGAAAGADAEELTAGCTDTRALIDSIRNLRPGSVTIHHGDRNYTIQEFVDLLLVPKFGEIEQRLSTLENTVREHSETLSDHEDRIVALEAREPGSNTLRSFLDATHVRLGAVGRLGILLSGPATGAGAASGELVFRFGEAHVGLYGRIEFGAQETARGVGGSLYLSGGAGLTFFAGDRHAATVSVGLFAEDLLEPFGDDPHGVMGSEVGVSLGAEASASIPLSDTVRLRLGLALAYGERSSIVNDQFTTTSGAYLAPSVGLEFQPDL